MEERKRRKEGREDGREGRRERKNSPALVSWGEDMSKKMFPLIGIQGMKGGKIPQESCP